MPRALLLIDIQRDYFRGGRHPLVGSDRAADTAATVLAAFRAGSEPVVHVQHSWDEPNAAYLKPGTPGFAHDDRVAPTEGEPVVLKQSPNAFVGTDLERLLRSDGIDQLIVAGMMTSMCVDATVRAAVDLGFTVKVVADACAAPGLNTPGSTCPASRCMPLSSPRSPTATPRSSAQTRSRRTKGELQSRTSVSEPSLRACRPPI